MYLPDNINHFSTEKWFSHLCDFLTTHSVLNRVSEQKLFTEKRTQQFKGKIKMMLTFLVTSTHGDSNYL